MKPEKLSPASAEFANPARFGLEKTLLFALNVRAAFLSADLSAEALAKAGSLFLLGQSVGEGGRRDSF